MIGFAIWAIGLYITVMAVIFVGGAILGTLFGIASLFDKPKPPLSKEWKDMTPEERYRRLRALSYLKGD